MPRPQRHDDTTTIVPHPTSTPREGPTLFGSDQFAELLKALNTLATSPVIAPNAVFNLASASAAVRVPPGCLPREIKLGRLQARKRGGRYYILGEWLLAWLASGQPHRRWRAAGACQCPADSQ
jgi:hypothetical protein